MTWTRGVAVVAGLLAVSGCVYGYQSVSLGARYSASSRPDASYYCYDCHGYRYFDPYYDWCPDYGFRYRWSAHPRTMLVYRERYVRIREAHPDYGRYRYKPGYRGSIRYRESRDYDAWRGAGGERGTRSRPTIDDGRPRREKPARDADRKDKGQERKREPRRDGERVPSPSRRGGSS
jgi:hypothetical protein